MISCGIIDTASCRGTGAVSRGGTGMMSCAGMGTVSCGIMGAASREILVTITALVFVGAGRFAFEAFEPIRRVSRGQNEGLALLQHRQRSE